MKFTYVDYVTADDESDAYMKELDQTIGLAELLYT